MLKSYLKVIIALGLISVSRASFVPENFDTTVKPQDDFYRYANGSWLKRTAIPPEYARWGSFDELMQRNISNLKLLCERASAQDNSPSAIEHMVGDFYASGMDEAAINQSGAAALNFEFTKISAIATPADVLNEIASLHKIGVNAGFEFGSEADFKDSNHELAQLAQGGLGLPDRDYYFRDDDKSKKLREAYVKHVAKTLMLLGDSQASAQTGSQAVMKLETSLAQASLSAVQLRNPYASYHKMTVQKVESLVPDLNLTSYFTSVRAPSFTDINLAHPDFFKAFSVVLNTTPISDWKTYLRWHLVHTYSPYLSEDYVRENFSFYGVTLTGTKVMKPRWKRVVTTIDRSIGEALGQLYVNAYFPAESKERALKLVSNLRAALGDKIGTLEWMDEATKQKAREKLNSFTVKIGYPDTWRDYSNLVINRGPYVLNVLKANAFEVRRNLIRIGKEVDKSEWGMSTPTVNAYYNPLQNEIVFPAGILQPPFFDAKADDAVNYGGIGAVIGHEMTHGFDDQGRQFDSHGNLTNWWSKESEQKFKVRSAAIVDQFNGYFPISDLHINGQLTQGENIADLGGLKIAYAGLQKALADQSRDKIDGFTPEQRFFISFASVWAGKMTPESLRLQLNTNPHSPGEFRTNGPLSNLDEFAQAFNVPEGAGMRRSADKRFTIW
ncbi:MAG: M13 family metallopeptidase [Verrucomicrobia bacterium]|nr:MAG: M13 family metallopeptidase [Verrucomicrobiota bacterium]